VSILFLSLKSLRSRLFPVSLCVISLAISVALFLGVERIRQGAEDGFTNTLSKTDLIVGARGGPLQLLLYSVFHIGNPINNIRYDSYQRYVNNRMIDWTIPFSLGDSYKGHRVVGTTEDFFEHYRYRGDSSLTLEKGKRFEGIFDVVLGNEVAKKFGHKVGDSITLAHGLNSMSQMQHKNTPFKVVGILTPTQTPVDKAVYVSLYGIEAMHIGWESGTPDEGKLVNPDKLNKEDINFSQISSFLVGAKSRIHTLRLRSMVAQDSEEPLMAIIPGLVLQQLWQLLSHIESVLKLISYCVLGIGLLGITITLYTSLQERRREMAILRSLGVGPFKITALLLTEAFSVVFLGSLIGLGLLYLCLKILGPYLESEFSIYLTGKIIMTSDLYVLLSVCAAGLIAGLIPALKASYQSIRDGLTTSA